jgi:hypothetical protein
MNSEGILIRAGCMMRNRTLWGLKKSAKSDKGQEWNILLRSAWCQKYIADCQSCGHVKKKLDRIFNLLLMVRKPL